MYTLKQNFILTVFHSLKRSLWWVKYMSESLSHVYFLDIPHGSLYHWHLFFHIFPHFYIEQMMFFHKYFTSILPHHFTFLEFEIECIHMWLILGNEMWTREAWVTSGLTFWENSMCLTTLFYILKMESSGTSWCLQTTCGRTRKSKSSLCHCSTTDKLENSFKKEKKKRAIKSIWIWE